MDDPSQQNNNMGQNTQGQQKIQFSEGTPYTEDQFLNREGRHEMQGRLTSLGYDTFGSDGSFGPNTRTAISNWQQDNGAPANGFLSGDQISQIRQMSQVSYAQWMAAHPIVVRRPVIVERVVRPRRQRIVVEERNPGLDAAIAVGVIGAMIGAQRFGRAGKFRCRNRRHC
jgi:peptidoglycan hydrolase-like protein with peptidoglycan-binding domain